MDDLSPRSPTMGTDETPGPGAPAMRPPRRDAAARADARDGDRVAGPLGTNGTGPAPARAEGARDDLDQVVRALLDAAPACGVAATVAPAGADADAVLEVPADATASDPALVRALVARLPWPARVVGSRPAAEGIGAAGGGATVFAVAVDLGPRWGVVRVALARTGGPDARARREPAVARGLVIAVYGVDGSGKSTLIERLAGALAPVFEGLDRWHLFQYQVPGVAHVPVPEPHAQTPRSAATSVAKIAWYVARAWFGRTPAVAAAERRGRLVVLDRDVFDVWVDPIRYRYGGPLWIVHAAMRLAPRPTLAIVLDADEASILARSGELTRDALTRLLGRYRQLAARHAWARTVDARRTPEGVLHEACAVVFEVLARRYDGAERRAGG